MIEAIFFNPWIWIVGILVGLLLLGAIVFFIIYRISDSYDDEMWLFGGWLSAIFGLLLAGFYFGALLPPYDTSFYKTYKITGELSELETAFTGEGGTMSQVFIAKVEGVDLYIRSEDQRFRTLNVGDDASLVCGKGFRYFQEPWYDCSFAG